MAEVKLESSCGDLRAFTVLEDGTNDRVVYDGGDRVALIATIGNGRVFVLECGGAGIVHAHDFQHIYTNPRKDLIEIPANEGNCWNIMPNHITNIAEDGSVTFCGGITLGLGRLLKQAGITLDNKAGKCVHRTEKGKTP